MKINVKRFSVFLMILATIYVGIMHYQAAVDGMNIKSEKEKYIGLIDEETKKNEELKKEDANLDTADSYETIARDDLGLLKSNETVFINPDMN
ncbi:MAG: septum formation initiator family protein [Clostridia bacterium]|nr:septum formation initiator family protein [Clostridia bacterium]